MAAKKKTSKAKKSNGRKARKARKSSPKITITGTLEALKDLALDVSKIPGLMMKRAGF